MKDHILHTVKQFLRAHLRQEGPLLLALSGGPDSMALYHLLLECQRWLKFEFHVVHVDHGWRQESHMEALKLQASVQVPFHLHCLKEEAGKTEESARLERLKFFFQIYTKFGCQALLLAHQAEDQAETVLKRIFEGAHFFACGGILPVTTFEKMVLWRPLLKLKKKELIAWLESRHIPYFTDPTNADPKYLRAKMRTTLLPDLAKIFGKEVQSNLLRLGQTAQEYKMYFDKKLHPYTARVDRSQTGIVIDLNPLYPFEKVELKAFLKALSEEEGLGLSYAAIETLYQLLEEGDPNVRKISCRKKMEVCRRKIAIKSL